MSGTVYYLNLREKLSIKKRIRELILSLTLFTFLNQLITDNSFSSAILYSVWLIAGIMFILNPILNWQEDRAEKKRKEKVKNSMNSELI